MTSRNTRRRAVCAAALASFIASAAAPFGAAANERCIGIAEQHLQSLGVKAQSIARTSMVTDFNNLEMGTIRRYEAWTSLKSCNGSVVTKLDSGCRIVETYGRGACRIEDIAQK
jgi:hypothetical protein